MVAGASPRPTKFRTGNGSLFCGVALPTPNCIRIAKRHSRMAVPFFVCLSFFLKGGRQPVARLLYWRPYTVERYIIPSVTKLTAPNRCPSPLSLRHISPHCGESPLTLRGALEQCILGCMTNSTNRLFLHNGAADFGGIHIRLAVALTNDSDHLALGHFLQVVHIL